VERRPQLLGLNEPECLTLHGVDRRLVARLHGRVEPPKDPPSTPHDHQQRDRRGQGIERAEEQATRTALLPIRLDGVRDPQPHHLGQQLAGDPFCGGIGINHAQEEPIAGENIRAVWQLDDA
jgi:hypothetical protein